jgi:hypothetical protein
MKTKKLLLACALLGLVSTSYAIDQVLNNFESGSPVVATKYGASYTEVANPLSAGLNTTANSGQIGRTSTNWYELIYFPVSFSVPANTKYYIHVLVKYDAQPDIAIRVDASSAGGDGSSDIRAMNSYSSLGQWQDLVFEVSGGTSGRNVIQINFLADLGFNNNPAGRVLNNTDKFAYIDEIIVNTNPLPRGTNYIVANNLWDFEPGTTANIGGVTTYADGNNPVTYPTTNPLKNPLNNTDNCGLRVAAATTNWWTGFEYSFSSPVQIDANHKYLHALVMVPQAGQKVVFDVKVGSTKVISDYVATIPNANEWFDVVLDVSTYPFISGGAIKCGHWDGTAAGNYYIDELYLDDNQNPRVGVTTSLNGLKNARMIFAQGNKIVIEPNAVTTANIFDMTGRLVSETALNGRTEIKVSNPGIYIVNIGNESTRVAVVF